MTHQRKRNHPHWLRFAEDSVTEQLASFRRGHQPTMTVWVRFAKNLDAGSRREPSPKKLGSFCKHTRSWVRFANTKVGSQGGFVLSNSADRELASFCTNSPARELASFLQNTPPVAASFCLLSIQQPIHESVRPNPRFPVPVDHHRAQQRKGEECQQAGQYPQISRQRRHG